MQGCFMQFLRLIFVRKLQLQGASPLDPHFSADFSILNSHAWLRMGALRWWHIQSSAAGFQTDCKVCRRKDWFFTTGTYLPVLTLWANNLSQSGKLSYALHSLSKSLCWKTYNFIMFSLLWLHSKLLHLKLFLICSQVFLSGFWWTWVEWSASCQIVHIGWQWTSVNRDLQFVYTAWWWM